MRNQYPSDEDLFRFIEQLEQQELYAPKNMKEEILNRAFPKQTATAIAKSKSVEKKSVTQKKNISLFPYRFKLVVGMAAAITMLMLIPMQGGERIYHATDSAWEEVQQNRFAEADRSTDISDINYVLNNKTRNMNEKMNVLTERLDNFINYNLGGNENEN